MTLGTTYTRTAPDGRQKTFTIKNEAERVYHLALEKKGYTYQQLGGVTDPFSDATIRVHRPKEIEECSSCHA